MFIPSKPRSLTPIPLILGHFNSQKKAVWPTNPRGTFYELYTSTYLSRIRAAVDLPTRSLPSVFAADFPSRQLVRREILRARRYQGDRLELLNMESVLRISILLDVVGSVVIRSREGEASLLGLREGIKVGFSPNWLGAV